MEDDVSAQLQKDSKNRIRPYGDTVGGNRGKVPMLLGTGHWYGFIDNFKKVETYVGDIQQDTLG